METTRLRRPQAPTAAERARSMVARSAIAGGALDRGLIEPGAVDPGAVDRDRDGVAPLGGAALVGTGSPVVRPLVTHVRADGSAVLVLPDDSAVLERAGRAGPAGLPAMLEVTDLAPVDLREPVRGLLWVTGWAQLPDLASARRLAMHVAHIRPHPALLDLGSGATLLRLVPGSVVVADAEGTAALTPVELAAARPDPFCSVEAQWLGHLERAHPGVLRALARHLPASLRAEPGTRVRPLGVDRCGIRLRVEGPDRDHDVRLSWEREVGTPEELREQLGLLMHAHCGGTSVRSTPSGG